MQKSTNKNSDIKKQNSDDAHAPEQKPAAEKEADAGLTDASCAPVAEPSAAADALEKAEADLSELKDKYMRLAAEYDNFRKRAAKERDQVFRDAYASAASAFLPVIDNFERAITQSTADESYKKGVELIYRQLNEILLKLGITEIAAEGAAFDPNFHNAVMQTEDDALPDNTVSAVMQKGYMIGERLLRPATVAVANCK